MQPSPTRLLRALAALAFAAGLALALTGCSQGGAEARPLTPVRTAAAQSVPAGAGVTYSANIVPIAQVQLAFKSGGYLVSIRQVRGADGRLRNLGPGDRVARGTVLALVRPQDYRNALDQAKAQLVRAQAEYEKARLSFERTSTLYAAQSATKPEYDSARAQYESTAAAVESARAAVAQAQIALGDCSLRAPMDAWVLQRNVEVGDLVGATTVGFTVADTRSVKAVFGVPDLAVANVKLGDRMAITTDALPGSFEGHVTAISPAADPKSRVYSVEVTLANPRNLLRAGMIATLALGGGPLARPVTAVPMAAVIRDPQRKDAFAVMVAEGAGDTVTVRARSVQLGDAFGNLVAVTSGLEPGERVVTYGATLVKDGEKVRIIP